MILKSELAAELGCPYNKFRLELREVEINKKFATGKRKYLHDTEATMLREHFKQLTNSKIK